MVTNGMSVPVEDHGLGEAFGLRHLHVGLPVDLDQVVAQKARDDGRETPAQRKSGQDDRLWRTLAERRENVQVDGEDEH